MKISKFLVLCLTFLLPLWSYAQSVSVNGDSQINQCDEATYTISFLNNSGNTITEIIVTNDISSLTEIEYVTGTTSIDVNGGAPICTSDPTIASLPTRLIWDIDAQCSPSFSLANGEVLNITYNLRSMCNAASGTQDVKIKFIENGSLDSVVTNFSVEVLPGAIRIITEPQVIAQAVGGNVTWTIKVENTGYGTVKNVVVTDVLGDGLSYVSSSPAGINSGQETTWGPTEIADLAQMAPNEEVTIQLTAKVVACENLENYTDARWGCDLSNDCYNTANEGATAVAAVQRIVKSPLIEYDPPDINFNYCEDQQTASVVFTNFGDGAAYNVKVLVDFGEVTVTNVSSGASYNFSEKRFDFSNPIQSGESYSLTFTLNFNNWCSGSPSGDLVWEMLYEDECGNPFYPTVELSHINGPANSPSLSLELTGAPAEIEIGEQITYTITSSYSGPLNCGIGSMNDVNVIDYVPAGFTVINAGGGVWTPGPGGTGGSITWTYTPPASFNTNITLQAPDISQCETYCFTTFENEVEANGTDCCGCDLAASASQTTAIECEELLTSEKTANPSTVERCDNIEYTNTYSFGSSAMMNLNEIAFEEHADHEQQYVPNSLSVIFDGNDITANVLVTDNTPGGSLLLDFSNAAAVPVTNKTLTIIYQLQITESTTAACSEESFYSWSSLNIGTTGAECLADGIIHETTEITVQPPSMSLSISGLNEVLNRCQAQDLTITLTQNSDIANPRDVKLLLSKTNYFIVDPSSAVCSGVAPISCIPTEDADYYIWEFKDAFTGSGQSSTINIQMKKNCNEGKDLVVIAYFDDQCNDDDTSDEICSVTATESPTILISGDLLIEKTPEIYYATSNMAEWTIYVTNRGSGKAFNVWVDDILGAGLAYNNAVVDNMTGVTISANIDHEGNSINGVNISIDEMQPGERRQITLAADLVSCEDLTNNVSTSWGCNEVNCQIPVSDISEVEIPDPFLINTATITTPITFCENLDGFITVKNAGNTICYNLQITAELATGLHYVPGSTRWRVNGGTWNGPSASYDPSTTTSPLIWTSAQIPALGSLNIDGTIDLEYDLTSDCDFNDGQVNVSTQYENPCGDVFNTAVSQFNVDLLAPEIDIDFTGPSGPINCGETIQWQITVTNNSGYTLPILWVENVIGSAYSYVSSTGDANYGSDNGYFDGANKVSWELVNVPHGGTATMTVTVISDGQPCDNGLTSTVTAYAGCGTPDGSSSTKPGQDPPDNDLCLSPSGYSDSITHTRRPSISVASVDMNPTEVDNCGSTSEITVTVQNTGDTDGHFIDMRIRLADGLEYVPGSSTLNFGGSTVPVADPNISGNYLYYYNTSDNATGKSENLIDLLEASGGNDTAVLKFTVESHCYVATRLQFRTYFYDCCQNRQYYHTRNKTLSSKNPSLVVNKTPTSTQVDCGENVTWTITVTNNGSNLADVVRVEDTLGDWIEYVTSDPPATFMGGKTYGWEFNNLGAGGGNISFTITGKLNPAVPRDNCSTTVRQDSVRAVWGCGSNSDATDGDPTTQNYDCTYGEYTDVQVATLLMPDLAILDITPSVECTADGYYQGVVKVRVKNQGDGQSPNQFTVTATDGQGWSGQYTFTGTLASDESAEITIDYPQWSISCGACGPYTFNATVDLNDDICECNETNNNFGPVNYTLEIPDLEVVDIDFSNLYIINNEFSGHVDVIVANNGCSDAGSFEVSLETEGTLTFASQTVSSLTVGNQTTVSFPASGLWTDCGGPGCVFTAIADATDQECECIAQNNIFQKPFAGPTNIELQSFYAEVSNDGVIIRWSTASEPENAGFNLYRSINENANYEKINPTIIPAKGTATSGAEYSFSDNPPQRGTYYYKLQDIDLQGRSNYHGPISITITNVKSENSNLPDKYFLAQNYPNPFNPETVIQYGLPEPSFVVLNIFDIKGHLVKTIEYGYKQPGYHSVIWNGKNEAGITVSSGIYIYVLKANKFYQTKKMIIMK